MISYDDANFEIRDDIARAHSRYWARLQSAGAWFTSSERIDIATEVRNAATCSVCRQRKEALSPRSVKGPHECTTTLNPVIVEAVHSITTDASRLTEQWYRQLLADGLTEGKYIEIVGTVVAMVSIDSFANAIGVSLRPLPEPGDGAPSRYRPATAMMSDQAWVPMVELDNADTPESDLWPSGKAPNVMRAMSLVPDEVRTLSDLSSAHYLSGHLVRQPGADGGRALSRSQMELLAGRISALNQCYY
jgi:hypothetical protein